MPSIVGLPPHDESAIRVVDISAWLDASSTQEDRDGVISALHDSCTTCGFFQLVGHGIPLTMQKQVLQCAETFFALPMEEKMDVWAKKAIGRSISGYEVLQWQTLQPGTFPDLKEGFYVGAEIPADDPRAGRFLQGPNLWPSSLPSAEFEMPLMDYRGRLLQIAELLLGLLRQALPREVPEDLFNDFLVQPSANLRLLHYPPQTTTDVRQLGAITLLLQQPGSTGLEVLHPISNRWVSVPAMEGRLVVNIGDLLSQWTGGYYKSAVHRVLNRQAKHRFSVPFFYNGNVDSSFTPLRLDGTDVTERQARTVEEHLNERLVASLERLKAAEIA